MYPHYSLTLMVTHACNLRCSYCYVGEKRRQTMPAETGFAAIDRAIASLQPGGSLELGFFGGEPLLATPLIEGFVAHALTAAATKDIHPRFGLTTNGTQTHPAAWRLMQRRDLDLAISCDGLPEVHDRHRRYAGGHGSSETVVATLRRLVEAGRLFHVVMVVRPDTLAALAEGVRFLRSLGVRHIEPSLDLWTTWSEADEQRLQSATALLADLWRDGLPDHSLACFDEKAAHLARLPVPPATRCGFGDGAVAVAPSGNLYPCERLIGQDTGEHPLQLAGSAADGQRDFLHLRSSARREHEACSNCAMEGMCSTFCRCSNYARTGNPRRPDRLLCTWNQACLAETARILRELGHLMADRVACGS